MAEGAYTFDQGTDRQGGIDRAVLLHGVDAARHEIALILARLVAEHDLEGAAVRWADLEGARDYTFVVVGCQPHGRGFALGQDADRRVWTLWLSDPGAPPPEHYDLGRLYGFAARLSGERPDCLTPESTPLDWVVTVLSQCAEHGWSAPEDVVRCAASGLDAQIPRVEDETEAEHVGRIAVAVRNADCSALGNELVALGSYLQSAGRLEDSVRVLELAHEVAIHLTDSRLGASAARAAGRSYRHLGVWEEAFRWYRHAESLAEANGDTGAMALAVGGTATTFADRGAMPRAREHASRALELAEASRDGSVLGGVHLTAALIARASGDPARAAAHAWRAARMHEDRVYRAHGLIQLGSVLVDCGQLDYAEQAYQAGRAGIPFGSSAWVLVSDAIAYVSALRGDRLEYDRRYAAVEPLLGSTDPRDRVQLHFYRAKALTALGDLEGAEAAHDASIAYARLHGFLGYSERSEIELEALPDPPVFDEETERIGEWLSELTTADQPPPHSVVEGLGS